MTNEQPQGDRHEVAQAIQVKFRCQESLKHKIDDAARENEVSISAEITQRLQSTFLRDQQSILETAFMGGAANSSVIRGISALLTIGAYHGEWEADASRRMAVRLNIDALLDALMPFPDPKNWDGVEGQLAPIEALNQTKALEKVVEMYVANVRGGPTAKK